MREAFRERRKGQGTARVVVQEAERSGKLVVDAEDVGFGWEGRPVVRDFSTTILRGDRVGIIGPNGAGKTTLLNLLLGRLQPDTGADAPRHQPRSGLLRPAARRAWRWTRRFATTWAAARTR